VVLDFDRKPGKPEGRVSFEEVMGYDPFEKWAEVPHAETKSGGRHYYFRVEESLRTKDGLLPGLDFLALGKWAYCAPREGYQWQVGGVLPPVPEDVRQLIRASLTARGGEQVAEEDYVQAHPIRALFNEHVDCGSILRDHSYQLKRRGPSSDRYLSPNSSTGNAGVAHFTENNVVYSNHGSELFEPTAGHDAFALYMALNEDVPKKALDEKGEAWKMAIAKARGVLQAMGIPVSEAPTLQECLERFYYIRDGDLVADLEQPPSVCVSHLTEFNHFLENVRVPAGKGDVSVARLWTSLRSAPYVRWLAFLSQQRS
jgi:hypothetical protein